VGKCKAKSQGQSRSKTPERGQKHRSLINQTKEPYSNWGRTFENNKLLHCHIVCTVFLFSFRHINCYNIKIAADFSDTFQLFRLPHFNSFLVLQFSCFRQYNSAVSSGTIQLFLVAQFSCFFWRNSAVFRSTFLTLIILHVCLFLVERLKATVEKWCVTLHLKGDGGKSRPLICRPESTLSYSGVSFPWFKKGYFVMINEQPKTIFVLHKNPANIKDILKKIYIINKE